MTRSQSQMIAPPPSKATKEVPKVVAKEAESFDT